MTVKAGSSATFLLNVVPVGNYAGTINLNVDGVQSMAGGSAKWTGKQIVNSGSQTLTLNTSASTPKGKYNFTALANDGASTKTMVVTVTVQ